MRTAPRTIAEYLATLSRPQRAALQHLRRAIRSAAPGAEECISYLVPGFRLEGRLLVSFGAATRHCAFYPGAHPVAVHRADLAGYDISKGTIRFPADRPLPAALVRKLVRTRIAEHAARPPRGGRGTRATSGAGRSAGLRRPKPAAAGRLPRKALAPGRRAKKGSRK